VDAASQCSVAQTSPCNGHSCPSRHHCHYLKCRYVKNPATGKFGIQVYHHGKEPHDVHHCKIYEHGGFAECHCFCFQNNAAGQVEDDTHAFSLPVAAAAA
jgi:hypothetical protein